MLGWRWRAGYLIVVAMHGVLVFGDIGGYLSGNVWGGGSMRGGDGKAKQQYPTTEQKFCIFIFADDVGL